MKKMLLATLFLTADPAGIRAGSLLTDGNFDNLPVGTAPDRNAPAGSWRWPVYYVTTSSGSFAETASSQVRIVPAPGGGGNALHFTFAASDPGPGTVLPNILAHPVTKTTGEILDISFDVFVTPGQSGGDMFFTNGSLFLWEFGPYLHWRDNGKLYFHNGKGLLALFDYPRGVWQTVRLKIDMAEARFDIEWCERGQPITETRTGMTFAGNPPHIDRVEIARPSGGGMSAYYDNFRVTTDPVITPVSLDLAAGSSATLQLTGLKVGSTIQWQRNGTDIAGATAATLEVSHVTSGQAGDYKAVVTFEGESVTTEASTLRVFDTLTITTPPTSVTASSFSAAGFSIAAVSALPLSYQWQLNGVDLTGETNRFLSLKRVTTASEGAYAVVVADANGSVVSPPATLVVPVRPTFVQAPLTQRVVSGGSVTFSAQITGNPAPFTYQWRKGSSLANSTIVSQGTTSEKTAFLTLTNVQPADAGVYRLYLVNAAVPDLTSTSPNRTWTLTVLPDTDGDGLPDEWEAAHGLNSTSAADAVVDSDGDGVSNRAEYQSGTVPTNAASMFRVEPVELGNGQAGLRFAAAANHTYTVERSPFATGGAWVKVVDIVAQAEDRLETVTDSTEVAHNERFYRVVTPRRP